MYGRDIESSENFNFKGFQPGSDLKSYCKQIYTRIETRAPSECAKTAFVMKTKNGYEGLVRIVSSSGIFIVTSSNPNLDHLMDDLYSKFSKQVSIWNQKRNLESSPEISI